MSDSFETLLEQLVPAAMATLRNKNYEQLAAILDDNANIDAIIDNIPQVRTLPSEREMGLAQNKSLAEWNLSQEPRIDEARRRLQATYDEAVKAKNDVNELKQRLDSVSEQRSLDTLSVLLQAAAQASEDESEVIAERFMNSEIEVDQFLKEFIEKKAVAHMRKVKSEKLLALLKQQHYSSSSSTPALSTSQNLPYPTASSSVYPQPPSRLPARHSYWS